MKNLILLNDIAIMCIEFAHIKMFTHKQSYDDFDRCR